MCALFGIHDYSNSLNSRQKEMILSVLSQECEVRGTDATGIAYIKNGKLQIYKRPISASYMRYNIPHKTKIIMGHTRMTTQGSEKNNCNNHPFSGNVKNNAFALAHNGILRNDRELRQSMNLPKTNIETGSYIAVQIIEKPYAKKQIRKRGTFPSCEKEQIHKSKDCQIPVKYRRNRVFDNEYRRFHI